jgi:beta-lactamase regulating signal transducer with metallopeptidase domain
MRTAGILQKLQPPDSSEEIHTAVKSDMENVNLGDAAPLLAVWAASMLVGVTLLVLERKARWMLMRRSHVPAQPNLQAV